MELRTKMIEISSGGRRMPAFVAQPAGSDSRPAVIVLMEAFGLVPNLKKEVERIARMGYVAIAPDVYHRLGPDNTATYDELPKAIGLMRKLVDAEFLDDMRATIAALRAMPEVGQRSIGVTGFCMGGRLSFLAACELTNDIKASAPFYGGGIGGLLDKADKIRAPLHLFFGQKDGFIPQDEVKKIDATLKSLGKKYELENYPDADHGFCCEERPSYNAGVATDAWGKLEMFFKRYL
jgi:carboxymethylenebutenolidase